MFVFYIENILVTWRRFRKKLDLNGGRENLDAAAFYSIFVAYFDLQSLMLRGSNSSSITKITVMMMAARDCLGVPPRPETIFGLVVYTCYGVCREGRNDCIISENRGDADRRMCEEGWKNFTGLSFRQTFLFISHLFCVNYMPLLS
jgi:hypothetical protein